MTTPKGSSTRLIGIKEFRQNMTALLREAQEKEIYFIIMRHAEPVAKVAPLTKKEVALEELAREIAEAREDFRRGRYYTSEEVMRMLRLRKISRRSRKVRRKGLC